MAYNFVTGDREQLMLMPPSVADWLPDDQLAWFVVDIVAELDLAAFVAGYRWDGRGGAAYDPQVMLAVLIYACACGERSSRRIERRLLEDVAFRVVAANQQPDHATIARFRVQHQDAIAQLRAGAGGVCPSRGAAPGAGRDRCTKLTANASRDANRTATELAAQILAEAEATDVAENAEDAADREARQGSTRSFGNRGGRRARLRELLDELQAEAAEKSYEAHLARRPRSNA